jgi:antitoxin HicB
MTRSNERILTRFANGSDWMIDRMANHNAHRESLEHYLGVQYPVRLIAEREGGYTALVPDLEGVMTQGETLEEAAAMAEDARRGWIEVEYERGNDIPPPSYLEEHSGKFNVRIPRSLHRSLAMAAEDEGISLNQYVVALLARRDAQARIERRLGGLESELHAIHAQLDRYHVTQLPQVPALQSNLQLAARSRPTYLSAMAA